MISKGRAGEKRESEHVPASRKSLGAGAEQGCVQCSPGSWGTRCLPQGWTTSARLARAGSSDWSHGMSPIHDHGVRHQTGLGITVHHPREARLVDAQCYYNPREPSLKKKKKKRPISEKQRRDRWLPGTGRSRKEGEEHEEYTFPGIRRVSSEDLMQNMVAMIMIWNCILKLLRVGLKSSQHTHTHMQELPR